MKTFNPITLLLLCALFLLLPLNLYATTYNSALNAYERGDYNTAVRQFTELAHSKDSYAQFMLGKIYASGEGIPRDYVRAYSWLQLAEDNGIDSAARLKNTIRGKMFRAQLNQAQRLADDLRSRIYASSQPAEITDKDTVRKVQQVLAREGFYYGRIDGLVGEQTRAAIRKYQRQMDLHQSGRITYELLNSMRLAANVTEPSSDWSDWENGDDQQELSKLKNKLRRLARRVSEQNAAEPWVIRRLQKLADEETVPWSRLVLEENFSDENYQGGDDWRVISGNFHLQNGTGLIVTPEGNWGPAPQNQDDITSQLLELLLSQAGLAMPRRQVAKIESNKEYSDSFALQVTTGPLDETEALIFSSSHDDSGSSGYRLVLQPRDNQQKLQAKVFKVNGNSASELKTFVGIMTISGQSSHDIKWTRRPNGEMKVTVDGRNLLTVTSPGDSRPFATLGVAHAGNRLLLEKIQLLDSTLSEREMDEQGNRY